MINLNKWAIRYGISKAALVELEQIFGLNGSHVIPVGGVDKSESYVQSLVRLEAPRANCNLFRNNVGVLADSTGRPVRYGLANDSKQVNERYKSADLIGWRKLSITPDMVGSHVAQFLSRECKEPGWRFSGTEREVAQLNWATLVVAAGGDAAFVTGTGSL